MIEMPAFTHAWSVLKARERCERCGGYLESWMTPPYCQQCRQFAALHRGEYRR